MSRQRRQAWLVGLMCVLLVAAAAWSVSDLFTQRSAARQARAELAECQRLAKEIDLLRAQPAVASDEAMGIQQLGDHIAAALKAAELDNSVIEGMFPQSEQPIGQTPYVQKPTSLVLRSVPLSKLAVFLYDLTDGTGLHVRDLRLRMPHGNQSANVWNADVTLTYLIYAPTNSGRPG